MNIATLEPNRTQYFSRSDVAREINRSVERVRQFVLEGRLCPIVRLRGGTEVFDAESVARLKQQIGTRGRRR